MKRLYRSGSIWAFWRWTDVDSKYITRLHLIKTPWFSVCVHWLNTPDPEPYLHNHPVTFLSLILRGQYSEWRGCRASTGRTGYRTVAHRWYNFVRANDFHRIIDVAPGTVTLAFMGPKVQEWGFRTPHGHVSWKDYYAEQRRQKSLP